MSIHRRLSLSGNEKLERKGEETEDETFDAETYYVCMYVCIPTSIGFMTVVLLVCSN